MHGTPAGASPLSIAIATAPRETASGMNRCPSSAVPDTATNSIPGVMRRLSSLRPVMSGSSPLLPNPAASSERRMDLS